MEKSTNRVKRYGSVPVLDTGGRGSTPRTLTMKKNKSAQALGKRSWKARKKGKTKKEYSQMMREVSLKRWKKKIELFTP